jgi:phosphatidylserine/phosphatidylglycerophosphate/cardiolipin synthase-like enzyme
MADAIDIRFLTQADDAAAADAQAMDVARKLASFFRGAKSTLDIAIYDFRLDGDLADTVIDALNKRAEAGIIVRLAWFKPKQNRTNAEQFAVHGHDPAPPPDEGFLQRLHPAIRQKAISEEIDTQRGINGTFDRTITTEGIDGSGHLMHSKYVIRDASGVAPAVWMGTANFIKDAWCQQDNNIVIFRSPDIAAFYQTDFGELWEREAIATTGRNDTRSAVVGKDQVTVWASFAPGDGQRIDSMVADAINGATSTVAVASMVISSGQILAALAGALDRGLEVSGVYDGPEMRMVEAAWKRSGKSADKVALWNKVKTALVGKHSTPFTQDGVHDFMHNKTLSVDGKTAVTGSFNFSTNATHNAENIVWISDPGIAGQYAAYIRSMVERYGHAGAPRAAGGRGRH